MPRLIRNNYIIVINSLSTEGITSIALDNLVGDHSGQMTEGLSNTIKSLKISETQGLPYELDLRVFARYLVMLNNNTPDGLVNGATGVLNRIDNGNRQDTSEIIPIRVWITLMTQTWVNIVAKSNIS